jgi:superfamily II DNA or RNA helicase
MKKPYNWQNSAVARFVRAVYFSIVADCGVGKTFALILIALAKMMPVIVIAPGHRLCEQWKSDIEDALGEDADVWVYSRPEETKQGEHYREKFEQWLTA